MVLGTISEKISTATVNETENTQSVRSPKTLTYIAPHTEAPTVCATVWNETMAAIGRSISRLNLRKISAPRERPSASTCACVTLSTTASLTEHMNDTTSDHRTTRTRSSMRGANARQHAAKPGRLASRARKPEAHAREAQI